MAEQADPHSGIDVGNAVLGAALANTAAAGVVCAACEGADFFTDTQRAIFRAITTLSKLGTIDELVVANALPAHRDYIMGLPATAPSTANVRTYITKLQDHRWHRELKAAADGLVQIASNGADSARLAAWQSQSEHLLAGPASRAPAALTKCFADVTARKTDWLWARRIAMGQLTILFGDAGLGKTHVALDLLARVTTGGELPDGGFIRQGNVIVLTAEDDWETTIKPRLVYAGADCARAFGLPAMAEFHGPQRTLFNVSVDLVALRREIEHREATCVLVDPLTAFLSGTDTHKQNEVRESLARINDVAERTGCSVICIMHPNRATAQTGSPAALYRLAGSLAFGAAARSVMGVAPDAKDDNDERRLLVQVKSNIAKLPDAIAFTIEGEAPDTSESRARWGEVVNITANEAFGTAKRAETPAMIRAKEFLRHVLISGDPQPTKVVLEEAEAEGLAEKTVRRAAKVLGVKSVQNGYHGGWSWQFGPDAEADF